MAGPIMVKTTMPGLLLRRAIYGLFASALLHFCCMVISLDRCGLAAVGCAACDFGVVFGVAAVVPVFDIQKKQHFVLVVSY